MKTNDILRLDVTKIKTKQNSFGEAEEQQELSCSTWNVISFWRSF